MAALSGSSSSVWKFSTSAAYTLGMTIKSIQFVGVSGGILYDSTDPVYVGESGGSFGSWDPPLQVAKLSTSVTGAGNYFLVAV